MIWYIRGAMALINLARHETHDFPLEVQTPQPQPFNVEVVADFTHESGETIAGVPGFYDGDDRWIIRFSGPLAGEWRGRTRSEVGGLDGVELSCLVDAEPENAEVLGPLRIDPEHPTRFVTDHDQPFILTGLECDWFFSYHQRHAEECDARVRHLREHGFNYMVTNLYAHSFWNEAHIPPEHLYSYPRLFPFGGDNDHPDHAVMNIEFFRDFDRMMRLLRRHGMMVHLMFQVQNKAVNWPQRYTAEDDRFWRYVTARYQAFSNVIWDIGKEPFHIQVEENMRQDYLFDRIAFIRRHDAYGRFVQCQDAEAASPGRVSELDRACDFITDQVHLFSCSDYNREVLAKHRRRPRPYLNIENGYELGVDRIEPYVDEAQAQPGERIIKWAYAIYSAGGYWNYYYCNLAWCVIKFDPTPASWRYIKLLSELLHEVPFNEMESRNDLVSRGFCLAKVNRHYWVFLPEGGDFNLDLSDLPRGPDREALWVSEIPGVQARWPEWTCKIPEVQAAWVDIYSGKRFTTTTRVKAWESPFKNPLINHTRPVVVMIAIPDQASPPGDPA